MPITETLRVAATKAAEAMLKRSHLTDRKPIAHETYALDGATVAITADGRNGIRWDVTVILPRHSFSVTHTATGDQVTHTLAPLTTADLAYAVAALTAAERGLNIIEIPATIS